MAMPGCVDPAAPASSLLLVWPRYEGPLAPPNATFATDLDSSYLTIPGWITQDAPQ